MFQGPSSLSGSAFQSYLNNSRLPVDNADPNSIKGVALNEGNIGRHFDVARQGAYDERSAEEKKLEEDMYLQGMQQQSQMKSVRGMPQQNLNQMKGYENVQDPSQFNMETTLPFDVKTDKDRNFGGIVNSFNPQLFQASEQMLANVKALGPRAETALAYKGSIYQGVPDDFSVNRLYILNTRQREESMYAFI